jgi:thiamine kinase-like enzyme
VDVSRADFQKFINKDTERLVRDEVVNKIDELFEQFGVGRDDGGKEKEKWCKADFEEGCRYNASPGRTKDVFSIGDLWTGSFLVSSCGERVGLVDWEFAGEGRPLQDMAQLCAHLRLLIMSIPSQSAAHASLTSFTSALRSSYRTHSYSLNPHGSVIRARDSAMKSAWILHGRELIYSTMLQSDITRSRSHWARTRQKRQRSRSRWSNVG